MTPLDEGLACPRDLYLTSFNTACPQQDLNPESQQVSGLRLHGHWVRLLQNITLTKAAYFSKIYHHLSFQDPTVSHVLLLILLHRVASSGIGNTPTHAYTYPILSS
jgi:hypothetical protein